MQSHSLGQEASPLSHLGASELCVVFLCGCESITYLFATPLKAIWKAVCWVYGALPRYTQPSSTLVSLFHTDFARFLSVSLKTIVSIISLVVLGLRYPSFCCSCMNKCLHRTVVKWPPPRPNSHGRHFFLFYLVDTPVAGGKSFIVE